MWEHAGLIEEFEFSPKENYPSTTNNDDNHLLIVLNLKFV